MSSKASEVMLALAKLAKVHECLVFLAQEGIVRPEAVFKGVRTFVSKNPCINEHLGRYGSTNEDKKE